MCSSVAGWLRQLVGGDRVEPVLLDPAAATPILREWPAATPQGVQMMRDAGIVSDTTPDAMEEAAGICPVFRVEGG